jgi:DNA-binding CsgD family transcriptional regulator/PAS domain-containing protein
MVTIDDFSRIVEAVYASAVNPDNWIVAVTDVRRTLEATCGALLLADGVSRSIKSASIPPEAERPYRDYYRQIDYVLDAVENGPVGLVRSGQPLVAMQARSEFDADWMRPHQMDDGLFVRLTDGPTPTCFLVAAPKRSEPFDSAERVKLVSALVPHLQQALRTQDHLKDVTQGARDIAQAMDSVVHGIVIVRKDAVIVRLNTAAERIVGRSDGLRIRSGCLEAARTHVNNQLHQGIAEALIGRGPGCRRGTSLPCSRPSGKRPYILHVLPVSTTEDASQRPSALVVIVDPEQQSEPPANLLRRLYGLTNAEAAVALRVLRGEGLKPICEDMALSIATIKTHLQHIFDKTDTHRQAELVRCLLLAGNSQWAFTRECP